MFVVLKDIYRQILDNLDPNREVIGYIFALRITGNPTVSLFGCAFWLTSLGSSVSVSSDIHSRHKITRFLQTHGRWAVVPFHSHPIIGLSGGDRTTFMELARAGFNYMIVFTPRNIEVFYSEGKDILNRSLQTTEWDLIHNKWQSEIHQARDELKREISEVRW